jgi:predicted dehydrogenase
VKIIFFGLGSIGSCHAKILAEDYGHELFACRASKKKKTSCLGVREVYTWDEVERIGCDVAFITNPTFLHIDTAIKCARLGMKLFIEKPIGCSTDNLDLLADEVTKSGLVSYVAYNLRFHPVIRFLKNCLSSKKVCHVTACNSSYLPNWRPGQDHLKSYSVSTEKGGGVVLDLSHEFDYIDYLFGPIESIDGVFGKAADVTLDAEDFMDAIVKTKAGYVNLHVNSLSLCTQRTIDVDCQDEYIHADLIDAKVESRKGEEISVESYESNINETYTKQMDYFFQNISNNRMMNNVVEASVLFKKILEFKNKNK